MGTKTRGALGQRARRCPPRRPRGSGEAEQGAPSWCCVLAVLLLRCCSLPRQRRSAAPPPSARAPPPPAAQGAPTRHSVWPGQRRHKSRRIPLCCVPRRRRSQRGVARSRWRRGRGATGEQGSAAGGGGLSCGGPALLHTRSSKHRRAPSHQRERRAPPPPHTKGRPG